MCLVLFVRRMVADPGEEGVVVGAWLIVQTPRVVFQDIIDCPAVKAGETLKVGDLTVAIEEAKILTARDGLPLGGLP